MPDAELDAVTLTREDAAGLTGPRRSLVATAGATAGRPVILIHGIFDNVWRWITASEARAAKLAIPEWAKPLPLFSLEPIPEARVVVPAPLSCVGLLERMRTEGMACVAYSYQDAFEPIAPMARAVEALHLAIQWSIERYRSPDVDLVGFSRGGLVARHALLIDSATMSAAACRDRVHRVISLASPLVGTSIATVTGSLHEWLNNTESVIASVASYWPGREAPSPSRFAPLLDLFVGIAGMTHDADEIRLASPDRLPSLAGGYQAIAGDVARYFVARLPMVGEIRVPPPFDVPELTDGSGDLLVSVNSALSIPDPIPAALRTLPVSHLTATYDPRVHDALLSWLRPKAEHGRAIKH